MHAMHTQTIKTKLRASDQAFRRFLCGSSMCGELLLAALRRAVLDMTLGLGSLPQGTAMSNCLTCD